MSLKSKLVPEIFPLEPVIEIFALGFPWKTSDPFLFCVHHLDHYPKGNGAFGPEASLEGRNLGNDFVVRDGFRMYHGSKIPGFPPHPHRGFETVTLVQQGLIDHSDSLGAAARFGGGDVQWLTAGKGIMHSEMFPLIDTTGPNTLELFQIWLNLPARNKMVDPHFSMLWRESIPVLQIKDEMGINSEVTVVAGKIPENWTKDRQGNIHVPPPPPNSFAANAESEIAIWVIRMDAGATLTLPTTGQLVNRMLYLYEGDAVDIASRPLKQGQGAALRPAQEIKITNGNREGKLLLLQGHPIGETVVQYGPFVMNTEAEIQQAFTDYRRTQFGGWPWPSNEPVHGPETKRFARNPNGVKIEP